jgi:hypothetical protein
MTAHRLINWLLALAIIAVYVAMQYIDGPTDHSAEQAQAASLADAIKTEAADARFARAAAVLCGPNAAAQDLGNSQVQCRTHKGRKTMQVAL